MADLDPDLEARALELPPEERARLAERLISCLDAEVDPGNETSWQDEAERRLDALECGGVHGIPAEKVFKDARSNLR